MREPSKKSLNIEIRHSEAGIRIRVWENLSHTRLAHALEVNSQFERDLTAPGLLRFVVSPCID